MQISFFDKANNPFTFDLFYLSCRFIFNNSFCQRIIPTVINMIRICKSMKQAYRRLIIIFIASIHKTCLGVIFIRCVKFNFS